MWLVPRRSAKPGQRSVAEEKDAILTEKTDCLIIRISTVLRSLGNGLVVDLGSGLGRDLLGVAKAYPQLRIELHDKPETMELAKDVRPSICTS